MTLKAGRKKAARQAARQVAQGAVGKAPQNWTNNELRALVVALLYKEDALNEDLTLRPLNDWIADE